MNIDKHVYSASSDGECCTEYSVDAVPKISDWKLWKVSVEQNMLKLSQRVTELETSNNIHSSKPLSLEKQQFETYATAENDGYAGLCTCIRLVRSRKAALLQCIWLVIFISILTTVCAIEFLRVRDNIEAEYKPERKYQTIDYYGDNNNNVTYEMPYIYIYFLCGQTPWAPNKLWNYWTIDNVNKTLKDLLNSQNFSTKIKYIGSDYDLRIERLQIEEAKAFYVGDWVTRWGFLGYFRLKPKNPKPSVGYFEFTVSIHIKSLTLGWTL